MPIGIGPSGPERSGANPILSATFTRRALRSSFLALSPVAEKMSA
jgi:hypothetical protein